MEQRIKYAKELYKNEILLKAALWLVVYSPGKIFKMPVPAQTLLRIVSSDYHGIDIIENPDLYETEVEAEIFKLFEANNNYSKCLDKDDLIGSLRNFLFKNKKVNQTDKWYILERSYRAYRSFKKIDDKDGQCDYDFRHCRKMKIAFNKLQFDE